MLKICVDTKFFSNLTFFLGLRSGKMCKLFPTIQVCVLQWVRLFIVPLTINSQPLEAGLHNLIVHSQGQPSTVRE